MKYLGSLSAIDCTLTLNINDETLPKKWDIITCEKIRKTLADGSLSPIYHVEAGEDKYSVYQDGEYVYVEN